MLLCAQVLKRDPDTDSWKMDTVDENKPRGLAPLFFQRILKTAWFHLMILMLVLANAIFTATIHFDHDKIDPYQKIDRYYYVEVSELPVHLLLPQITWTNCISRCESRCRCE